MKKLLMILILPLILVSCGEPDKFNKNDRVVSFKECIGFDYNKGMNTILESGIVGIVVLTYNGGNTTKIVTENNQYGVTTECLRLTEDVLVKKPTISKYTTVQEYTEFQEFCKEYSKLFKQNFKVEVSEKDQLTCDGKLKTQLEYDIELIQQYKGVK